MSITISLEHVGKQYRLGQIGTGTLCHDLNRWCQTRLLRRDDPYAEVGAQCRRGSIWALHDVNCGIEQGELVGIIGRNGAGKSTLLKLLSRITAPTCGKITVNGRIASLLEVGTGFHPELTGRENVYFNGALMGLSRKDINARLDEIVDFAEVADYIDTPVKRYSSGMWVRLGFAIAAHLEPDILVVDEVLAVGDISFQRKAIGRMSDEVNRQGRTVLFVSHNMGIIKSLCRRGIVLDKGHVACDAPISDALKYYTGGCAKTDNCFIKDAINTIQPYLRIKEIRINGSDYSSIDIGANVDRLNIYISGNTRRQMRCSIKMVIMTMDRQPLASFVEGRVKGRLLNIEAGDFKLEQNILLPRYMAQGDYLIDLSLHEPTRQDFFIAPECCILSFEGNCDQDARRMELKTEGMWCLESAD